jgi:hypothetical protein
VTTPWFDPAILLWAGPAAGTAEAIWGGSLGVLAYAYARKGGGRRLVFTVLLVGLGAAVVLLASGLLAWLQGQPSVIFGSLMGMGAPLLVAAVFSLFTFSKIYRAAELRRMRAMDL